MEVNKNVPRTVTCLGGPSRAPHPLVNPASIGLPGRRVLYDGRCLHCCEQLVRHYLQGEATGPVANQTARDWLTALITSLDAERKNMADEMRYAAREPTYDEGYRDGQTAGSREGW
jgi:hypothetical protein